MKELEGKVSRYNATVRVICRVLYRCEVVDIIFLGYNDDTAGMLTCGLLYTYTAVCKSLFFCFVDCNATFFKVLFNVSVCVFVGNGTESTCTENVF